jgi:23S rRNA (guanosine2251-2'-O)-methyltransferase
LKKESFVYGIHPVLEALHSGREIEKIMLSSSLKGTAAGEIRTFATKNHIPVQFVPNEWFNKLGRINHQGALCYLSVIEYQPIEQLLLSVYERGETPFLLILDRITDVRNFGAIARTAECAGVHAIIVPSRGHALITADAIKTSAGALNTIPVCRADNLKEIIDYLKESGLQIVSATEKADKYHMEINFSTPVAIIMGSEEDGVSPAYLKMSDEMARIPMNGEINSLNVSVATGIMLFEAVRQRRKQK